MTQAPPGPAAPRRRVRLRPERRRRGDVVAAVVIVVAMLGAAAALWRTSAAGTTTSRPAAAPVTAPPAAGAVPGAFTEAWRARSGAAPDPIVTTSAVVTADGATVQGRDARTGDVAWTYARDRPLCTAGAAFPSTAGGPGGRLLALYAGGDDWCSELTVLHPDTGARAAARNPDARPGTRLLAAGSFATMTGADYLETVRSDMVKTAEYGAVLAPAQPGRQPRTGCTYGSVAATGERLGVLERCPGETVDRLTVLAPDPADAEKPEVEFSVPLPAAGAVLVALSAERAAVALPGPARLLLLDRTGQQVGLVPLEVPDTDLVDPPGRLAAVTTAGDLVGWWTGSRLVLLGAADLAPVRTLDGVLGPATAYGGTAVVPVPDGVAVLDAAGAVQRTVPVVRIDRGAPVRLAAAGEVLLEQRGAELVAMRPAP